MVVIYFLELYFVCSVTMQHWERFSTPNHGRGFVGLFLDKLFARFNK